MKKIIKNTALSVIWLFYISTVSGVGHTSGPYISGSIGKVLFAERFVRRSNEPYLNASPKSKIYYDLGAGYKLNHNLRVDVNVQQRKFQYSATEPPKTLSQGIESYSAFINFYYAKTTETGFGIYFTAGAGCAYNKPDPLKIEIERILDTAYGEITTNFAYNIGAGVIIPLVDLHTDLDLVLSYRYVNLGKFKVDSVAPYVPSEQSLKAHEIEVGFIFNL